MWIWFAVCRSDRRYGLFVYQFCYRRYITNSQSKKQHRKMKEKSAGEKYLADLIFMRFAHAILNRKSSCCEKFTKIIFYFFPLPFASSIIPSAQTVPAVLCLFVSYVYMYQMWYPCYSPLSSLFFLVALFSKFIISTGLSSSSGNSPTITTRVGSSFSHI